VRHLAIREKIGVEVDDFDRRRSGWIGRRGDPDTRDGEQFSERAIIEVACGRLLMSILHLVQTRCATYLIQKIVVGDVVTLRERGYVAIGRRDFAVLELVVTDHLWCTGNTKESWEAL
jgi:hypothetical protein